MTLVMYLVFVLTQIFSLYLLYMRRYWFFKGAVHTVLLLVGVLKSYL